MMQSFLKKPDMTQSEVAVVFWWKSLTSRVHLNHLKRWFSKADDSECWQIHWLEQRKLIFSILKNKNGVLGTARPIAGKVGDRLWLTNRQRGAIYWDGSCPLAPYKITGHLEKKALLVSGCISSAIVLYYCYFFRFLFKLEMTCGSLTFAFIWPRTVDLHVSDLWQIGATHF